MADADRDKLADRRVFLHDAFLSHRVGDGALQLREALAARGCNIWYDHDERITNRRVMEEIGRAFTRSRLVIAHLAPGCAPSPWTRLEIEGALASEQACNCTRLVLYSPLDRPGRLDCTACDLGSLGIDEALRTRIGQRPLFTPTSLEVLAALLRSSNEGPGEDPFDRNSGSTARCRERKRARLHMALGALGEAGLTASDESNLPGREDRFAVYGQGILDAAFGGGDKHDASYALYILRNLEAQAATRAFPRTIPELRVILAITTVFVGGLSGDDRANAYMLLKSLARTHGDPLAARYLRTALAHESDWAIVRFMMPTDVDGASWWPQKLLGVERAYLARHAHSRQSVEAELKPLLADAVRLRLSADIYLRANLLPDAYQIDLQLHWLSVVSELYSAEPEKWHTLMNESGMSGGGGVEIELALRKAFEPLGRLLTRYECGDSEEEFERSIAHSLAAIRMIVHVSEHNEGRPLSEFRTSFVDWLLPLLGLCVQYGDLADSDTLSRRAIALLALHLPSPEIGAYMAMVDDCIQARLRGIPRNAMPVRMEFDRITIKSRGFRGRWG